MLNLQQYRHTEQRLADHLPWAALVAPGVVLNKDGSFQRTFRFRGPDLESATEAELIGACARVNNALRRLGSGWAFFVDAERIDAPGYPTSQFPDAASWLVEEERKAAFVSGGIEHFENVYHMTLMFLPPTDRVSRFVDSLFESEDQNSLRNWRQELDSYVIETDRIFDLFAGVFAEIRPLSDQETLTYLHGTVSDRRHPITVPETPMYLDAVLADTPLIGGMEPQLGTLHLRTITIMGFPAITRPGILDALNHCGFTYRWTTRFICLDKSDAAKELTKLRRQWFSKRKSLVTLLREGFTNEPAPLLDSDAENKAVDADAALQDLGSDLVSFGYMTTTVTVADTDRRRADDKIREIERVINSLGFARIRETLNAVEAWLGSLPGQVYANVRQPLVHTLNLSHLMPLSAVWAGPIQNEHLKAPVLFYAETAGSTPFRFSTHAGDVGHMLIVGPTGAGKSVLLSLLALQFRRYENAQVYIFDKGNSARAAVLAMEGQHHVLGSDGHLSFQPLADIDKPGERSWALEWVCSLLAHESVEITPEVKEAVWSALQSLSTAPRSERTLTGLTLLLQANAIRAALKPYTLEGAHGQLLDAADEDLSLSDLQCFETEKLLHETSAVMPVMTYLFHRLEARFDGRPTLLILDEAWVYLDNPIFAARIREWLKVLRKRNVSVVFATQSLADIAGSTIAPALIESCPQRIFLPNERAIEPQSREAYARFGLNERQIDLIATAIPKRHYYLQSAAGNRLFELGLGPATVALCGSSAPATQKLIETISRDGGHFAAAFLAAHGLEWAASRLSHFTAKTKEAA